MKGAGVTQPFQLHLPAGESLASLGRRNVHSKGEAERDLGGGGLANGRGMFFPVFPHCNPTAALGIRFMNP